MCYELQVKWQRCYLETWCLSEMLESCWRWSGNNFIQAEFKINLSKNRETACWKSKWQIVWIFMNFLSSSHSRTMQWGACQSCRRTLWYNEKLDVVSYRSSQLLIAGSSPCVHFWSTGLYMVLKNVCSFYPASPSSFGFNLWSTVMWARRKCSVNESIINIVPVL